MGRMGRMGTEFFFWGNYLVYFAFAFAFAAFAGTAHPTWNVSNGNWRPQSRHFSASEVFPLVLATPSWVALPSDGLLGSIGCSTGWSREEEQVHLWPSVLPEQIRQANSSLVTQVLQSFVVHVSQLKWSGALIFLLLFMASSRADIQTHVFVTCAKDYQSFARLSLARLETHAQTPVLPTTQHMAWGDSSLPSQAAQETTTHNIKSQHCKTTNQNKTTLNRTTPQTCRNQNTPNKTEQDQNPNHDKQTQQSTERICCLTSGQRRWITQPQNNRRETKSTYTHTHRSTVKHRAVAPIDFLNILITVHFIAILLLSLCGQIGEA